MLDVRTDGPVAWLTLNRPEVGNAFNDELIRRLIDAFDRFDQDPAVRAIVVTGAGKHFSAGGDFKWMLRMKDASPEENSRDTAEAARLWHRIYRSPKPVIARVNGAARGGGVGLVAVCDIAVAVESATFALSEVRIGLIPAIISPFLIRKMNVGTARRLFITGEEFDAAAAMRWGLVSQVVAGAELDSAVHHFVEMILRCGPRAVAAAKSLSADVAEKNLEEARTFTADLLARLRPTPEALEGMSAFLGRRAPAWCK